MGEGTVFSLFVSSHLDGGEGYPVPRFGRGGGDPIHLIGGYPIPGLDGGYHSQLMGYPIPGLDGGVPYPRSGWEVFPGKDWMEYPLVQTWERGMGVPPSKMGWGTPIQEDLTGYPPSKIRWGTPLSQVWMG